MYVNTVAKAYLLNAVLSQFTIFTADCLPHPIQMEGVETRELHTLFFINSCFQFAHYFVVPVIAYLVFPTCTAYRKLNSAFSGFSVGFCINEEEGYLLPNIARKITCRRFD